MRLTFRDSIGADRSVITDLLKRVKLPTESLDTGTTAFSIAEEDRKIVGTGGFEFYGTDALLRSVAVPPELQKRRIGDRLVDYMIAFARLKGVKRIVLLTETAEKFFAKKGFKVVDRSSIENEAMKQSSEFTYACPTSAVCMMLELKE
jgi:amino-acid N-acetyltransferase